MYSRELCTSKASVRMMPSRHLLPDLSVTISCSSGVRLRSVTVTKKNPLALVGGARFRNAFDQGRDTKRLRLAYLDRLGVDGATPSPERLPWEPRTSGLGWVNDISSFLCGALPQRMALRLQTHRKHGAPPTSLAAGRNAACVLAAT